MIERIALLIVCLAIAWFLVSVPAQLKRIATALEILTTIAHNKWGDNI